MVTFEPAPAKANVTESNKRERVKDHANQILANPRQDPKPIHENAIRFGRLQTAVLPLDFFCVSTIPRVCRLSASSPEMHGKRLK